MFKIQTLDIPEFHKHYKELKGNTSQMTFKNFLNLKAKSYLQVCLQTRINLLRDNN